MFRKIINFTLTPRRIKKLLLKDNFFTDGSENLTRLIRLIKKTVKPEPNELIIDIGAFDGQSSVVFSKAFENQKIIAFEPNPEAYIKAVKITSSYNNIVVHNCAISNHEGTSDFMVTENQVSSSLNSIDQKNKDYGQQLVVKKTVPVKTGPIDNYTEGKKVLFMKVDTQGHELEVFKGAVNTLKNTSFIIVEMANHNLYSKGCKYYEVDQLLREHNFKLADIIVTYRKHGLFVTEYDAIYINTKEARVSSWK